MKTMYRYMYLYVLIMSSIVTVYFIYMNRCINGGKSNLNEDQSSVQQYFVDLEVCELKEVNAESMEIGKETEMQATGKVPVGYTPYSEIFY